MYALARFVVLRSRKMFTYNSSAFNLAVIKIIARCKLHEALRYNITSEALLARAQHRCIFYSEASPRAVASNETFPTKADFNILHDCMRCA